MRKRNLQYINWMNKNMWQLLTNEMSLTVGNVLRHQLFWK